MLGADPTVIIGGGTTVALVTAGMTILVRIVRLARDDIRSLQKRESRCERRLNTVVNTLRENNIIVPDSVWDD